METATLIVGALLKTICVANRVHRPLSRGNGSLVKPSSTELLPLDKMSNDQTFMWKIQWSYLDWSPTTSSF